MKTYEDLLEITSETGRQDFVRQAINEYQSSDMYKKAVIGYDYYCRKNTTIRQYQKLLITLSGQAVPDNYSANYKFANNFFQIFAKQEVSHLLGNGVTFNDEATKNRLGGAQFDNQIYRSALAAIWGGVSFNFLNYDHIDVFKSTEFVPIFGEEDGALHAGIRFWRIDTDKPMRVTLYEEDGYTEYKYIGSECTVLQEKRPYMISIRTSDKVSEILDGMNYPSFPIVPLYANEEHQTELEGLREKIDGYDLIQSGLCNTIDEASVVYWTITNAGEMDDIDLAKFVERMKTVKAAVVDENGGSTAQAHTIDVPYQASTSTLQELRDSLYRDAMALDTDKISAGNVTATAIEASYENLTLKCDAFEMCLTDCIKAILALMSVDDDPTYKRSKIINMAEDTQMVLSAAQYLDDETILNHLPFISPDEIDEILKRKTAEEAERYADTDETTEPEETGETEEAGEAEETE